MGPACLRFLKNRFWNNGLACFERSRDVSRFPSARFLTANGARMAFPFWFVRRQTMIGSRATASKRLPRLSTLGDTLFAGPKSTIRT